MFTSDEQLEIDEQELGTYVFPNSKKYKSTWALFVYRDGSAEFYQSRNEKTGALLGKPIQFPVPSKFGE